VLVPTCGWKMAKAMAFGTRREYHHPRVLFRSVWTFGSRSLAPSYWCMVHGAVHCFACLCTWSAWHLVVLLIEVFDSVVFVFSFHRVLSRFFDFQMLAFEPRLPRPQPSCMHEGFVLCGHPSTTHHCSRRQCLIPSAYFKHTCMHER
jgi:hypothetical protein